MDFLISLASKIFLILLFFGCINLQSVNAQSDVSSDPCVTSQSIEACTEAIKRDPQASWAYVTRGMKWQEKEELDKAISDFSEAIRLGPKNSSMYFVYYNRGTAWASKLKLDKAIPDFHEAIQLNPKFVPSYTSRGIALKLSKDNDKAIADFSEALRLDPNNTTAKKYLDELVKNKK